MGTFFSPDRANDIAANQPPERPQSLDQYAAGDGQMPQRPLTQIGDRAQAPLIDKDGTREQQGPILHVNNFDQAGRPTGTSEYKYTGYEPSGVRLNGYVDRDNDGNIKEFVVRKPALFKDQKDVFMVFRATPDHPIDEKQMNHVFDLLRPDGTQKERYARQLELDKERPMAENLQRNNGNQIMAIRLDPQTGQRFTVRDMEIDPNTGTNVDANGRPFQGGVRLCWTAPDGNTVYRVPLSVLPDVDKKDLDNAGWHGNMRTPLQFLTMGQDNQQPVRRNVPQRRQ